MGNRNTTVVASILLFVALIQLGGLLRPTVSGVSWQMLVLGSMLLAAVITWTGLAYRAPLWAVAAVNLVALVVVALQVMSPSTMRFIVPTGATLTEVGTDMSQATSLIRTGIEPVLPIDGIVAVVIAVFWVAVVVTVYGLLRSPGLAVVPGLVLVIQFAVMDRTPTSLLMVTLFTILLATSILAVTSDQRRAGSGRMVHKSGWLPSTGLAGRVTASATGVALFGTVFAVGFFSDRVPFDGMLSWRTSTGLTGDYLGGVSYNPFIGIQQSLVSQTSTPLFYAQIEGDLDPTDVSFRLLTMETYDRGRFYASRPEVTPIVDGPAWHTPGHEFAGPAASITSTILIDRLETDWLPTAYAATTLGGDDDFAGSVMVRPDDGALRLAGGLTYPELSYTVTSDIPQPDPAVLSGDTEGALSPLFEAAADGEAPVPAPVVSDVRPTPPSVEVYLGLPENLEPGIAELAERQTAGLETPFEIGLALESWFRSDAFEYTTDIAPGHGATDLAQWLLPENSGSPNFRRGYCEQFATSMAVLARTLDIPSWVVLGFTPGRLTNPGSDTVVVMDRNAHAWVELWIPAQGWVAFDPTPRPDGVNPSTTEVVTDLLGFDPTAFLDDLPGPELVVGSGTDTPGGLALEPELGLVNPPGSSDGGFAVPAWTWRVLAVVAAAAVLLGGLPLLKRFRRSRRMRRLRSGDITAAWEEIVAQLTDFGRSPQPSLTPDELARMTDPAMEPLAMVYGRAVYGPPAPAPSDRWRVAEQSLVDTSDRLAAGHSRWQRLRAMYSPASLIGAFRRPRRDDRPTLSD